MIFGEITNPFSFEIHHAHYSILHDQGHRDFRAHIRMRRDIARVSRRIGRPNDLARYRRRARDALAEWNIVDGDALVIALAEAMRENLPIGVQQENAEGIESHQRVY